jgi:hypothetical protein
MSQQHTEQEHRWIAFSTAIASNKIMVECEVCHASGAISDPSASELKEAFFAPNNPYPWKDNSRVEILKNDKEV